MLYTISSKAIDFALLYIKITLFNSTFWLIVRAGFDCHFAVCEEDIHSMEEKTRVE